MLNTLSPETVSRQEIQHDRRQLRQYPVNAENVTNDSEFLSIVQESMQVELQSLSVERLEELLSMALNMVQFGDEYLQAQGQEIATKAKTVLAGKCPEYKDGKDLAKYYAKKRPRREVQ